MTWVGYPWPDRLFAHTDRSGGPDACWLWMGAKDGKGYGLSRNAEGRTGGAHRLMYTYLVGPIADGLQIDHLCRVRNCVNPAHLEPVTPQENRRRQSVTVVGRCRKGHDLTQPGAVRRDKYAAHCRECSNAYHREYRKRRKAAQLSLRAIAAAVSPQ